MSSFNRDMYFLNRVGQRFDHPPSKPLIWVARAAAVAAFLGYAIPAGILLIAIVEILTAR
jgi:hypothetical protein